MINTFITKFTHKPIDEVRDTLIGMKIVDIEENGRVIYLEDEKGNQFCIDTTGEQIVVNAFSTDQQRIEVLELFLGTLLDKLEITEDELMDMIEQNNN